MYAEKKGKINYEAKGGTVDKLKFCPLLIYVYIYIYVAFYNLMVDSDNTQAFNVESNANRRNSYLYEPIERVNFAMPGIR